MDATLQDVKDEITKLGTDVSAEIQAAVNKITAIQAQPVITAADLGDLKTSLQTLDDTVTAATAKFDTPDTGTTGGTAGAPTA